MVQLRYTGFGRFRRDISGASLIEFALLVPVLMLLIMGTLTLFDLFRTSQNAEKATFTIGDILSRQQPTVDKAFLNQMYQTFVHLVPGAVNNATIRVSSIVRDGDEYDVEWSQLVQAGNVDLPEVPLDTLPDIADGDSVILTETYLRHPILLDVVAFDEITYRNWAVTRPRFVPAIGFVN